MRWLLNWGHGRQRLKRRLAAGLIRRFPQPPSRARLGAISLCLVHLAARALPVWAAFSLGHRRIAVDSFNRPLTKCVTVRVR